MTNSSFWEILKVASGLGFVISLPISGGTLLGFFLDQRFGSAPILTIVFLVGGIFLACFAVFKKLRQIQDATR